MRVRVVHSTDMPAAAGPHPAASPYEKQIGKALGLASFAVYQVELPPGAETVKHDHLDDGTEDMYAIVAGGGSVVVNGSPVTVRPDASSPSHPNRIAS